MDANEKELLDNIKIACESLVGAERGCEWRRVELGKHLLKMKAYLKEQPKSKRVNFTVWLKENEPKFGLKHAALHKAMQRAKEAGNVQVPFKYTVTSIKHDNITQSMVDSPLKLPPEIARRVRIVNMPNRPRRETYSAFLAMSASVDEFWECLRGKELDIFDKAVNLINEGVMRIDQYYYHGKNMEEADKVMDKLMKSINKDRENFYKDKVSSANKSNVK